MPASPYYAANLALRAIRGQMAYWPKWTWRPRYSRTKYAAFNIEATVPDPHDATGIPDCPRSFNEVTQTDQSMWCPICYGVGITGGFAPAQAIRGLLIEGGPNLNIEEEGEMLGAGTLSLLIDPALALLPQDLLLDNATNTPYYVLPGERMASLYPVRIARAILIQPLAPEHPWRQVPIPALDA